VLASLRPAEVIVQSHPLSALRHELRLQRLADEIVLEAFSEADVGALLGRRLADGVADPEAEAFVQALHLYTGGLPLFVDNMLDELVGAEVTPAPRAGSGVAMGAEAGVHAAARRFPAAASLTVPSRIADVLETRLVRLDPELQQALSAASVAGAEFVHLPLARALQMQPEVLQELLDAEALHGRWLRSTGAATLPGGQVAARYAFRHGLYRHVLYQRLPAAARIRWHRAVGEAVLALYGDTAAELAGELALHFERGRLPLQAMRQFMLVARRALNRSAATEALRAVQQGMALLPDLAGTDVDSATAMACELDLRVLEGIAMSRLHVLAGPEVGLVFERTKALCASAPASPARARAQHGLWWVSFARGELDEADRLARRLLDDAAASGEESLFLVGASAMGLTQSIRGDPVRAREYLGHAIELSDRLGDALPPGMFVQDPGVEARAHMAVVCWWLGEPAAARRHAAEAVQRAQAIRHRIGELIALHMSAALHCFAGEMQEARECTGRLYEVIRTQGLPTMPGTFSWLHGRALVQTGEVEEGLALMHTAEQSCRTVGMLVGITGYWYHLAEANASAGRADDALAAADEGLRLATGGPEKYVLSPLHRVRAELLHARGEREAAAAALREALAAATAQRADGHELAALTCGLRGGLLPAVPARARLRELLGAYEGEQVALAREARALLAA
jgi:tetratricopeptide (TPR) repeat protein